MNSYVDRVFFMVNLTGKYDGIIIIKRKMLKPVIHRAIIQSIIYCCSVENVPEWIQGEEKIVKGAHPFQLLRVLGEFFRSEDIVRRVGKVMEYSSVEGGNRTNTAMEDFNGLSDDSCMNGGLGYNPRSHKYSLSYDLISFKSEEEIDQLIWRIYSGYKVQGMFVHKYSGAIGEKNYVPGGGLNGIDQWVYDVSLEDDEGNFTGSVMTNFSERTKKHYILLFLKNLCETYKGEEKMNPSDRPSWYEISEFIQFYIDIWDRISGSGDDEIWWKTIKKDGSNGTIYELTGFDVRNEVVDNFRAVYLFHCYDGFKMMKIGNDMYAPYGIWLHKYKAYCQRMCEEEDRSIYEVRLKEDSIEISESVKLLEKLKQQMKSVKDEINADTYKDINSTIKKLEECM